MKIYMIYKLCLLYNRGSLTKNYSELESMNTGTESKARMTYTDYIGYFNDIILVYYD